MGKVAAALGIGPKFTHEGKDYTLAPWTYKVQAEFERYLEDHAQQVLKRMQHLFSPEEFLEEKRALRKEITSGKYTFGSDAVAEALTSLPHLTQLFYLMLKGNHPEVTRDLVAKMVEGQMEEVMSKMAEANADPSTPPPQTTEGATEETSQIPPSSPS